MQKSDAAILIAAATTLSAAMMAARMTVRRVATVRTAKTAAQYVETATWTVGTLLLGGVGLTGSGVLLLSHINLF